MAKTQTDPSGASGSQFFVVTGTQAASLPPQPIVYKTKKSAQDAHEAIRPTSLKFDPEKSGASLVVFSSPENKASERTVVDLNAVPPAGIEGVKPTDKGTERDGLRTWGALGVGGTKMKIHKKAIRELFEGNDRVLDAEEVLAIGRTLE